MKEKSKKALIKADEADETKRDNVETLQHLKLSGVFTHVSDDEVATDQAIENILMPYDTAEKELPDAIARDIQKDPNTGRFALVERLKSIWLMQVIQDRNEVPMYKIITMITGFGVQTLKHWWRNRQKWIEYNTDFTNTSLKVIKMNFITALLRSSNALNEIDFGRLAKSRDPRDHANLLKITDGLAARVALADSLLNAMDATAHTEAVEGEVSGIRPVAPDEEIILLAKGDKEKDDSETGKEQSEDS